MPVEKEGDRIVAVIARDIRTGKDLRFAAPLFADCTGDGTVGALAGAEYRMGRESWEQTGETLAPQEPDKMTMGTSVQWYTVETLKPRPFPECPWALRFTEQSCERATRGDWNWETGLNKDQIADFESIRDHGLRAVYGNWAFLKNHSKDKAKYANRQLSWVAYIAGKRESRRLLGDVILTQQDVQEQRPYPDAFVTTTWSIDLHYPDPANTKHFPGRGVQDDLQDARDQAVPDSVPLLLLAERREPLHGRARHQRDARGPRHGPRDADLRHDGRGRRHGRLDLQESQHDAARRVRRAPARVERTRHPRRGQEGDATIRMHHRDIEVRREHWWMYM